ncbi:MAG: carbohydrate ABC transporter permease, partial [Actinobacteria bacterium]|nr:carbohydrate ABC transporter permease [Actinomycetota bacterium]
MADQTAVALRRSALRRSSGAISAHTFLVAGAIVLAGPFVWELLTSFKSLAESTSVPPTLLPSTWRFGNYDSVFQAIPFGNMLINSAVNAVARTCGQLLFCSMAAYAFAWLKFPGRKTLFALFLSVLLIPSQLLIIPQYQIINSMRLLNT